MSEPRIASAVGIATMGSKPFSKSVQGAMERAVHQARQEGLHPDEHVSELKARIMAARDLEYDKANEIYQLAWTEAEALSGGVQSVLNAMREEVDVCVKAGIHDEAEVRRRMLMAGEAVSPSQP